MIDHLLSLETTLRAGNVEEEAFGVSLPFVFLPFIMMKKYLCFGDR